ncbi:MAG: O-antigen ligase family protein, partial [Gammaproteobacteria bacterium]|nr:O-antigen ligase family protein [Gammaproteobacteria bacterium]
MARLTAQRTIDLIWLPVVVVFVLATILPLTTPYPYLAIAPALGALALLAIGRRPQIGLYAIIFLIPFGNFRKIAGPLESIKIHWLLALILLVLLLIRLLVERGFVASLKSNLWPWFLLYLAVSLLSSFFSDDLGYVAHQVSLLLVAMLFFTLTIAMLDRESLIKHIPIVISLSVSLGSLLAVLGNLTGMSGFSEGATFSRSTGGTTDPNSLALQIIFGMPFLVFWLFHARHLWSRLFAAILILINLAALVGTYSRSGTLVIGATLLILLIINSRDIRPRHLG